MFHFLLTTLLLDASIRNHFSLLGNVAFSDAVFDTHHIVTFGDPSSQGINHLNVLNVGDTQLLCSSDGQILSRNAAIDILEQYVDNKSPRWQPQNPLLSCVIIDTANNFIFLIGDGSASVPLWYAFKEDPTDTFKSELLVSSDLLTFAFLGFNHITAVGPGMTICMDTNYHSILSVNHWSSFSQFGQYVPAVSDAPRLSLQLLQLLSQALPSTPGSVINELDTTDTSSLLLECALTFLEMNQSGQRSPDQAAQRTRYVTPALVTDLSPAASLVDDYTLCK
jgi:hypothetical protein